METPIWLQLAGYIYMYVFVCGLMAFNSIVVEAERNESL